MKGKFLYGLMVVLVAITACGEANHEPSADAARAGTDTATYTTVQWVDSVQHIGTLKMGDTATITFKFKNTGNYPLFIVSANPGCGCTVADYPKGAIAPGGEGAITAQFDTNRGSVGEFRKNLTVTTNTRNGTSAMLYFMGDIVMPGTPPADTTGGAVNRVLPRPDVLKKKLKIS